jgi:Rrf2 family protein
MEAIKREAERSSLMNLGRRVDYAVRALSYLASQPTGRVIGKAEIERQQDIPPYYLSKIMRNLVASGFVRSHAGCKGGFSLARPAETISIKAVYESVEKPLLIVECLEKGEAYCQYTPICNQRSVWQRAQNLLAGFLAGVSIGQITMEWGLRDRLSQLRN